MAGFRTSARPKLVELAGFASAARAELALAIAARDAHTSALAAMEAAGPHLQDDADRAWGVLEAAKATLAAAQATAAEDALAAAVAGGAGPRGGVTAARMALTAAEDDYDVCKKALADYPERYATLRDQEQDLAKRVQKAAARVLGEHPAVSGLAAHVAKLQRETAVAMQALSWMRGANVIETKTFEAVGPGVSDHDRQVNGAIELLYRQGRNWFPDIPDAPPMLLAALERLKSDANATLPEVVL